MLTNGFGIMINVYNSYILLANSLGTFLAYCLDLASSTFNFSSLVDR